MSKDIQLINASLKDTNGKPLNLTIRDGSVTANKIQNEAITKEKISSEVIDSSVIKDEDGNLVPSPFKYVQNDEFIFAMVDAEDKLLAGIQWDGTPVHGKTSSVEDRMQSQINLIADRVATIMGDEDTTNVIDTMNELKAFFANIENTETLTGILANLDNVAKNLDKTAIKDEKGNVQDTPFKVIENEEFIHGITDSEDRLLFGIYRATGKPYFPLNDMYHVEQNEDFFAVWLDAADHVLLGIRRDGEIIGEIHAVNALKQVASQLQSNVTTLQEKVDTIDASLQELLSVFSLQDNEEYLAVETDADGKVLSATNADGSHYIHKVKSETIPEEFEHIEDPEGRMEITTDADGKVLGYRDEEGTRHEHKISAKHLELSDEAATEVNEAFKSAGIKMENPSDFSKDNHIELPIPRIAAQVKIYAPKLPTTKSDNIEAEIEYNDKDGNYFRKPVILNAQGDSSLAFYVKNLAIDFNDSEIKFGDFPTQDSFHLKKYYIDNFRGRCIVGYWLMEQIYKSHPIGKQYPYEYLNTNESFTEGTGDFDRDYFVGSKCHPDGFPIVITWVNLKTLEETWMGIYTWNLKKTKEVYHCNKKNPNHIILDGQIGNGTIWGNIKWTYFEIRNPKTLKDTDGNKYDGDNPKELSETDELSVRVKRNIENLSSSISALKANNTKETFEKYFLVEPMIDFVLLSQFIYNWDGFYKNWIWVTYDGQHWTPTVYDLDSTFGSWLNCMSVYKNITDMLGKDFNIPTGYLQSLYNAEIQERYKKLRDSRIFSIENITNLFQQWMNKIGGYYEKEFEKYSETPSYRSSRTNDGWEFVQFDWSNTPAYDDEKTYAIGETCQYGSSVFKATAAIKGVEPCKLYQNFPRGGGMYDSLQRVVNWMEKRINELDNIYKYN